MKSKIEKWLASLKWIDGSALQIEEYRLDLFRKAFSTNLLGRRKFNMVLSGRGKKNHKSCDLTLAGLFSLTMTKAAQGNDVLLIANSEDQAGDDLDLARKIVAANPHLLAGLEPLSKEIRRRDGRGVMRVLPANNVAGMHGKSACMVGYDEIHGMTDWSIMEALQPDPTRECLVWITSYDSILDVEGAPLHDLKKIGMSGEDPRMLFSWYSAEHCTDPNFAHLPPEQRANPSMASWNDPDYLDQQRRRLPSSRFRRLHLNLPGSIQGAFFSQDMVDAAIVKGRSILDPMPGISYLAAVDMSGGSSDDATLSISYWDGGKSIVVGVWEQDGSTPFNPRVDAVAKFAAICKRYGCSSIYGDDYAGQVFKNDFADCGITYVSVKRSKSDFYEGLEVLFNAKQVELPGVPKLRRQLLTLVRKGATIDHPSGQHDDWATSAAIAANLVNPNMEIGGADGWLRFYAQQIEARDHEAERLKRLQEQPASRMTADMDDIRAPGPDFGFSLNPAPLLMVKVPPQIAAEGRVRSWRKIGDDTFTEMTRVEAAQWMQNPVWAGLNPDIARQLAGAEMQRIDYVTVMVPPEIAASTVTDVDGREYRVEIKNGRGVVRVPADAARQLLNSGAPSCVPWHRENTFLAARIGACR